MKNELIEMEWREHSSYHTIGEAKQKSIRIEMFTGRPTKIFQNERTKFYWILVGINPIIKKINKSIGDF